jgi:hypothetical protein
VSQTWILSFQQIKQQHILASELLSFMSLLDRQDIPARFLSYYIEQKEMKEPLGNIELTEALGVQKDFPSKLKIRTEVIHRNLRSAVEKDS